MGGLAGDGSGVVGVSSGDAEYGCPQSAGGDALALSPSVQGLKSGSDIRCPPPWRSGQPSADVVASGGGVVVPLCGAFYPGFVPGFRRKAVGEILVVSAFSSEILLGVAW